MHVEGECIHLHVSQDEANVLIQALGRYQGPWMPDQTLNDAEKARRLQLLDLADQMRMALEAELHRRWLLADPR